MNDTAPGQRLWPYVACATLVAFPYAVVLLLDDYVPGVDEAFQLEAALRLVAGEGYTASQSVPRDLATPTFQFLVAWPIGYSALISGLLTMGIPLALAAKLIKLAAIVTACVAWVHFAHLFLRRAVARIVFGGCLGFYVAVSAGWTTDVLILALFPALSRWMAAPESYAPRGPIVADAVRLPAAGTLAGLAVVLKYSAFAFVLLGSIWIAWSHRRQPRAMIRGLVLFGLPAACIVVPLQLVNYLQAGRVNPFTEAGVTMRLPGWWEWTLHAWKAAFFDAPYVPMLVVRELSAQFGAIADSVATAAASMAVMGTLVVSVVALLRRGGQECQLASWLTAAYVSNVLYLGLTTGLYVPIGDWTPLMEGRYFMWLVPGMVLCVLTAAGSCREDDRQPRLGRIVGIGVLATCVGASTGYAVYVHRLANALSADTHATYEALSSIVSSPDRPRVTLFLDAENFRTFPRSEQRNTFLGPAEWQDGAYFSRPTVVAMVCTRVARFRSERGRNYCATDGFDRMAAEHRFTAVQVGARNTLYWRFFAAGAAE